MNKHKNFFAMFLLVLMMVVSCSQGNLEIVNINEEMSEAETTLTININSATSRTLRPEVVKWKVELFKSPNESAVATEEPKSWASRILKAGNTSTTFTNIACATYTVSIYGYADDDCTKKVLFGECPVGVTDGESNLCTVNVEDYFEKGVGGLKVIITGVSGLAGRFSDNNGDEQTVVLTLAPLKSTAATPKPAGETISLTYKEGTLTGLGEKLPAGIYEISGMCSDINLVQDPIVNIYADTTTDISWEWDLNESTLANIDGEKALAKTIIPVWIPQDENYPNHYVGMKKTGFLHGNALFAVPEWQDDLDYKNFCLDNSNDVWILSSYLNDDGNEEFKISDVLGGDTFLIKSGNDVDGGLIIRDMTKCKFKDVAFVDGGILLLGEVEYMNFFLYYATFEEEDDVVLIRQQFDLSNFSGGGTVTSIATKGNDVYIATATGGEATGSSSAQIYKGTIDISGDGIILGDSLQLFEEGLTISNFFDNSDGFSLSSPSLMISDMYIDSEVLYFTAGCVCVDANGSSYMYYSFGGLFKYVGGKIQEYGVNKDTKCKYYDYSNVQLGFAMQAENESDNYFAGPRCIIPSKNTAELFVVDSGFYADINANENTPPTEPIILNKRNRIFVFDTETEDLSFTNVADSVNFDFEQMTLGGYSWNGSY